MNYYILAIVLLIITFTLLGTILWNQKEPARKWVAVGLGDTAVAVSDNGIDWDPLEDVLGVDTVGIGRAVYKGGERWVVVGSDGDDEGDNVWWSNDGEVWNAADSGEGDDGVFGNDSSSTGLDVLYANGIWVAVGQDGSVNSRTIWWSNDAKEWYLSEGDNFGNQSGVVGQVVAYDNERWLVGGGNTTGSSILWSDDGITWTSATMPTGLTGKVYSFAYGNGVWVAAVDVSSGTENIWYSEDNGESWISAGSGFFGIDGGRSVVYNEDRRFVATGENQSGTDNRIYYSTDGKTWTESTYPAATSNQDITPTVKYLNDSFYVFREDDNVGDILTSPRGTTFTNVSDVSNFRDIEYFYTGDYNDGVYVVGGKGLGNATDKTIWYSTDGIIFNPSNNQPFGEASFVYDIVNS